MIPETTVDWKAFEYKYSDNPQRAFENLTYYLFCHEFQLKNGIFRYYNQPHIETNPIQVGQKLIGFQSKYYSDSITLSSKESDLTAAVRGAADRYPGITTLYFYISREFSPSSKKDELKPAYQVNIEKAAQKLGISIEWKVRSNIEAQLMYNDQLSACRNVFFRADSAVQKCCENLNWFKDNLFDHINTDIPYKNHRIVIENTPLQFEEFLQSECLILLIDGAAGSGKSALVKHSMEQLGDDAALLAFQSTDLDVDNMLYFSTVMGNLMLNEVLDIYSEADTRVLYIDAAEKYFVLKNQQTFEDFLSAFINADWKIVLTIRTAYQESLLNLLLNQVKVQQHHMPPIGEEQLTSLSVDYGFHLPIDQKIKGLLSAPFYLRLYLALDNLEDEDMLSLNMEAFEEKIWDSVIRHNQTRRNNMPTRREKALIKMTMTMLADESYYYDIRTEDDGEAFDELEQSGVIIQTDDARNYCHSHDVFEELVVGQVFRKRYEEHVEERQFFDGFHPSLRIRKLFRGWLSSFSCIDGHQDIIFRLLGEENVSQIWKDEIILTLISTEALKAAFWKLTEGMGDDQSEMLKRIAFFVNTCCRKAYHEELYLQQGILFPYRFSTPEGYAWKALFTYIAEHMTTLSWDGALISVVIDLLESWTRQKENAKTETTEIAGKIGLFLLDKLQLDQELHYIPRDEQMKTLYSVLLNAAWMIKEPLSAIFQTVQDGLKAEAEATEDEYYDPLFVRTHSVRGADVPTLYMDLAECAVSDITQCGNVPCALPETTIQLMNVLWTRQSHEPYYDSLEMDGDFGLANHTSNEFHPICAYKTPIMILLQECSSITIDFLIDFFNRAGETYYHSRLNREYNECFTVEIQIGNETIVQIASDRLWKMHRGTHVGPDLLISLLMGLEQWLLMMLKVWKPQIATAYCKKLITKSNNVMLTSLVVSAIEAHPEKLFDLLCDILKTKELFHLDASRLAAERSASFLLIDNSWFTKERKKSNELPHRKKSLESIILNCQTDKSWISKDNYNELQQQLYRALDAATVNIDNWDTEDKYAYYRIDLRHYRDVIESKTDKNGYAIYTVAPDYSEDMKVLQKQSQEAYDNFFRFFDLQMWSEYRFNNDQRSKTIEKYSDTKVVLQELKELWKIINSIAGGGETTGEDIRSDMHRYIATVAYSCAVLLRDSQQDLEDTDRDLCISLIFDLGYIFIQESNFSFSQVGNGLEAVITGLVLLANEENRTAVSDKNPLVLLLKLVLRDWSQDSRVIKQIADTIWKHNKRYGWILLRLFALLADRFEKEALIDRSLSINAFIDEHKDIVLEALQNDSAYITDIDYSLLSDATLFTVAAFVPAYTEEAFVIAEATKDTAMELSFAEKQNGREKRQYYRDLIGYSMNYVVWLADVLLHCQDEERKALIDSFLAKADFQRSDNVEYLLKCLISKQDERGKVNEFWYIWELLKPRMIQLGQEKERHFYSRIDYPVGNDRIVTTYLFANTPWRKDVHRCALLSEERASFFDDFIAKSNSVMAMLYALSQLLYTVGKEPYKDNGINWLYQLIANTSNCGGTLYNNTLFYMEEYVGVFFSRHRMEFRTNRVLAQKTQAVLEYMLNQGSQTAYFIREQI